METLKPKPIIKESKIDAEKIHSATMIEDSEKGLRKQEPIIITSQPVVTVSGKEIIPSQLKFHKRVEFFDAILSIGEVIKKTSDNFNNYFDYLEKSNLDHYDGLVILEKRLQQLLDNLKTKKSSMIRLVDNKYSNYNEKVEFTRLDNFISYLEGFLSKVSYNSEEKPFAISTIPNMSLVELMAQRQKNGIDKYDKYLPELEYLESLLRDLQSETIVYLNHLIKNKEKIKGLKEKNTSRIEEDN